MSEEGKASRELTKKDREALIRGGFDLTPRVAVRTIVVAGHEITEWENAGISITSGKGSGRSTIFFGVEQTKQLVEWLKGLS